MPTQTVRKLKKVILQSAAASKEGHVPSAFSILDILWVLYDRILRVNPRKPDDDSRDRLILSKGHASLGIYAVLAEKGFFPFTELQKFGTYDSLLGGHPDRNKVPGIEASTGSLGHGFPMAVGAALALRIKHNPARVYAIIGDGECNEGSIWEAVLLGAHHKLSNLCLIIDSNHSNDRAVQLGDLKEKFHSFGWSSVVINGHNHSEIQKALRGIGREHKPLAVIAETIKGYGCKDMENNHSWHHRCPNQEELQAFLQELS